MHHLKTLLPYFRPYRRGVAAGLLLVLITNVFTIISPFLLKVAIDLLETPTPEITGVSALVVRAANFLGPNQWVGFAILLVITGILGGVTKYGMRELLNGISRRMDVDLRNDFFEHLLRLDAAFYDSTRTGDLMARATNDTQAVRQAAGPAIMYAVNTTVSFTFALTLMLFISPRLTGLALIPMVFLPPVVLGFGKIIHRRFEKIQEQFSTLSTMVQENLTGARIVRAYVQEDNQAKEFDELNREYLERNMLLVRTAGMFHPILGLLTGGAMVIVLWIGGREVILGAMSVGDFVAFGFYLLLLTWPMIALGWVVNLVQRGAASIARINRIMSIDPGVVTPATPAVLSTPKGAVEFRNVSFRYPGTERDVLKDISFRAEPGQTVAVVGPTGSGKTTLVSLIPRLYDPDGGEVLIDGVPTRDVDPQLLRRTMGVVPQDPFLFSTTIEKNIALGQLLEPDTQQDGQPDEDTLIARSAGSISVIDSAQMAQLHESIVGFPRGYETLLGERGINLSGGQKQRATLARAIARDPMILILDDALSAVDTHTESQILSDLREVLKGRTSFIISHRVTAVMNADLILVLKDGEIVERGTHTYLLAAEGVYSRLLRRQMLEEEVQQVGV